MPLFSVIIPSYGRPDLLRAALDSVLAQSIDDFEVIIVDDCSPEPVDIAANQRVRVVRTAVNSGAAAARNLGVANATGEVLAFLDDDDEWGPDRLRYAVAALERAPVAVCWHSKSGRVLNGNVHDVILDTTTPNLGCTAIARSAWLPLDESYRSCEDLVWWLDITERHDVATTSQQGLFVRTHDGPRDGYGTEQRIADSLRLLQDRSQYFARHRRAAAFRWQRIGLMEAKLGNRRAARQAFAKALITRPNPAALRHLLRTMR